MDVGGDNAGRLAEPGNGSNEAEVVDLERGSEAVNPQGPGNMRQES